MQSSSHKRPLWIGVLLASMAQPLCMLLFLLLSSNHTASVIDIVLVVAVSFPISLLAMLMLGLPYVLWLRSLNRLNSLLICAGSMAIGAISIVLLRWILSWDLRPPELAQFLVGAGVGLTAGIAFCVGVGPNNSFKPKPLRGSA
jgi:hypothetical protein